MTRCRLKDEVTEGQLRPIAEAARDDRYDLPPGAAIATASATKAE